MIYVLLMISLLFVNCEQTDTHELVTFRSQWRQELGLESCKERRPESATKEGDKGDNSSPQNKSEDTSSEKNPQEQQGHTSPSKTDAGDMENEVCSPSPHIIHTHTTKLLSHTNFICRPLDYTGWVWQLSRVETWMEVGAYSIMHISFAVIYFQCHSYSVLSSGSAVGS